MKICLIHNLYEPYAIGGAEQVVKLTLQGLRAIGQEAFVISTRPLFKRLSEENDVYYLRSFQFIFRSAPKLIRLFWHIAGLFNVFSYWRLAAILKKEKPDIVMTHNLLGIGFLVPRLIRHLNIKHIHVLHDIQLLHPSGLMIYGQEKILSGVSAGLYQKICAKLFSSANTVISPSDWLMQEHFRRGFFVNSRRKTILNPASFDLHGVCRRESAGRFRLLYVGQIEAHKGVYFLIQAFSELIKNNGNFSLSIIGAGQAEEECKTIAAKTKNIVFLGKMTNEEVKKTMVSADCLIVPSLCYENSPTVMYESAGAGLPVVASRLGGISELARVFGGLLFRPGDRSDLIKKIIWASKNPGELKKITDRGVKKIHQLSSAGYARELLDLY